MKFVAYLYEFLKQLQTIIGPEESIPVKDSSSDIRVLGTARNHGQEVISDHFERGDVVDKYPRVEKMGIHNCKTKFRPV